MPPTAEQVPGPVPRRPPRFDPAGPVAAPAARDGDALAEPMAAAVLACPAVARLSAGPYGTVGTYLPGRRVTGVLITDHAVTIRLVAHPVGVRTIEAQVRAAAATVVPGLPVDIAIDDLDTDLDDQV